VFPPYVKGLLKGVVVETRKGDRGDIFIDSQKHGYVGDVEESDDVLETLCR